jgi:hypothetical protein
VTSRTLHTVRNTYSPYTTFHRCCPKRTLGRIRSHRTHKKCEQMSGSGLLLLFTDFTAYLSKLSFRVKSGAHTAQTFDYQPFSLDCCECIYLSVSISHFTRLNIIHNPLGHSQCRFIISSPTYSNYALVYLRRLPSLRSISCLPSLTTSSTTIGAVSVGAIMTQNTLARRSLAVISFVLAASTI